jgi:hypothetical protein
MKSSKLKKKASDMTDKELMRSLFPKELVKNAEKVARSARKKGKN